MELNFTRQQFDLNWKALKNGDKRALERIYREHAKALISYGYKVSASRQLIEDSIHDLFIELWQARERISETTSVKFYLFRALRYKIMRNLQARGEETVDIDDHTLALSSASYESSLIGLETHSLQLAGLKSELQKLPERQQEAIVLRYLHEFSNEEVAHIMGVNYQSVCNLICTALRKLKVVLQTRSDFFPS